MDKILKFVHIVILFVFLLLVLVAAEQHFVTLYKKKEKCALDVDCLELFPNSYKYLMKCVGGDCISLSKGFSHDEIKE
ncbi:putative Late nodulin [Medicago truncatula]|uniref:Late nodulin n=1 Tax=Medicago truncatula TaxID=3880 RepID=A0A072THP2_MEDTR|nr:late nodulin [Medicago truncatula]RHN60198.1 putative Late nodulin [Medicago truncatula]